MHLHKKNPRTNDALVVKELCHSMSNNLFPVQERHSTEAVGRVFNNWSVIQTATLKLVTTCSCHGEYQTGLCLCVREKHKSHSPPIKAARLVTRECAGCIFLSLSLLCSLLTVLLVFLFCPFSLLSFLPKGVNGLFIIFLSCDTASSSVNIISTRLSLTPFLISSPFHRHSVHTFFPFFFFPFLFQSLSD